MSNARDGNDDDDDDDTILYVASSLDFERGMRKIDGCVMSVLSACSANSRSGGNRQRCLYFFFPPSSFPISVSEDREASREVNQSVGRWIYVSRSVCIAHHARANEIAASLAGCAAGIYIPSIPQQGERERERETLNTAADDRFHWMHACSPWLLMRWSRNRNRSRSPSRSRSRRH